MSRRDERVPCRRHRLRHSLSQGRIVKNVSWPHAETRVDEELVRYLLRTQFPAIAEQECWHIGEGFDNFLWRVGDHLVVRLPRREAAVTPMENEINWLNVLAQRISLRTPAPLFAGA